MPNIFLAKTIFLNRPKARCFIAFCRWSKSVCIIFQLFSSDITSEASCGSLLEWRCVCIEKREGTSFGIPTRKEQVLGNREPESSHTYILLSMHLPKALAFIFTDNLYPVPFLWFSRNEDTRQSIPFSQNLLLESGFKLWNEVCNELGFLKRTLSISLSKRGVLHSARKTLCFDYTWILLIEKQ